MSSVTTPSGSRTTPAPAGIDPRGPRFGAAITTVVLAAVLLTGAVWLLAVQAIVFALGALAGPGAQPYGIAFRRLVRPRLAPPAHLEDPRPPRFAQAVGLGFALLGLAGYAAAIPALGGAAVALALAAAFLNAAFGFCLGCEMYLLGKRALAREAGEPRLAVAD